MKVEVSTGTVHGFLSMGRVPLKSQSLVWPANAGSQKKKGSGSRRVLAGRSWR